MLTIGAVGTSPVRPQRASVGVALHCSQTGRRSSDGASPGDPRLAESVRSLRRIGQRALPIGKLRRVQLLASS